MFYVYVLKSQKDRKNYTGMTNNLTRHISQHNRGSKETPSTASRGPFSLIYVEEVKTRQEARIREKFLKTGVGREFIKKHIPV